MGSLVAEPTYLSHGSAAYYDRTDPKMITIVHKTCSNYPKFLVAKHHGVDLLFCGSDSGDLLVVLKLCRYILLDDFHYFFLLATLVLERFVLCCLGAFGGPMYYCLANGLCLIMLSIKQISPLLSFNLDFLAITCSKS